MPARSKARKRALDVLYASELRSESATEALDRAIEEGEGPSNQYTADLVRGVVEHQCLCALQLPRHPRQSNPARRSAPDPEAGKAPQTR